MTPVTCRLTAKNRDQLRNPTLGNRVRSIFTLPFNNNNNKHNKVCVHHNDQSHCERSLGAFDECRLSAGWPPTLRPSQLTWAVSPPKTGSYYPHPPSPLLSLLSPSSDTHFTVPRRVEGCVDVGSTVKVRSPCPRLYVAAADATRDENNLPQRDSNLGPLTPQSDALTTRLLRPASLRAKRRTIWRERLMK